MPLGTLEANRVVVSCSVPDAWLPRIRPLAQAWAGKSSRVNTLVALKLPWRSGATSMFTGPAFIALALERPDARSHSSGKHDREPARGHAAGVLTISR